ncbi:hypothetical protein IGI04_040059 [Brassica rapa subsp. trilocularis]|uniref:Protein kinase domain-containing protein n=1 Tax=Brassica rapa subsp. trilocularis TaxID=1813537 RepID=A0ABQ7KQZ7_BRACM|nr:hypothetical protein IGI04_040059 [Brassica rapa subsp. trilocularis]
MVLHGNLLLGTIPKEIGNLFIKLTAFLKNKKPVLFRICRNLQSNGLTGKLPPELGNLKYLKELHIDRNRLRGSLLAASYPSKVTSFQGNCMQNKDLKHRPSSSSQCAHESPTSLPKHQSAEIVAKHHRPKWLLALEIVTGPIRFLDVSGNIYAFGVLLLEIVSGRPPFCKDRDFLTEWLKHFNQEELETVCEAARQCLDNNSNNNKKPSVEELCEMLECEISLSISAELRSSSLAWAELALDS